jgi:UDP-3-O-[3-hydroxymyristoyl] glucosamine N-acyltransferase
MKLARPYSVAELAEILGCDFAGETSVEALGINEVHVVEEQDIAFVDHPKYYDATLTSAASIIIIDKKVPCPDGKALLIHPEPFTAFNTLILAFTKRKTVEERIAPDAVIGNNVFIHATASIGSGTVIGDNTIIHANASIGDQCVIGKDVILYPNTTIGGDAFYYKTRPETFEKLISCGRVVIEDGVEIGAGCTIDRGVTGDTVIGEGTKIDNMVQVGHDTKIGKRCLFASQVGIAGCVTIEDKVTIWGQAGVIANVTIGSGAVIMAQAGVGKSLEGGKTYFGSPAGEARKKLRELATLARISQ